MNIDNFKEKLQRYEAGTASEADRAIIEAWYRSYQPEENQVSDPVKSAAIKQAIQQNIHKQTAAKTVRLNFFYRIAASVVLLIGAAWLGYSVFKPAAPEKFNMVKTGIGELKEVMLPDSSVMWVNAMSRVRISEDFSGRFRKVYIDNGEAFFKVKHDVQRPFRVYVSGLQVQVLGTSFNISAYSGMPEVRVGVATGKVAVMFNDSTIAMLTPGKELSFNRDNHIYNQHNADIGQSQGWRDGRTYLNQASFAELAVVVSNLYNIKLKPANQKVNHYQFTLRLQRGMQTSEVLNAISIIHNTHFRKEGNEVVLY
ncbi:DUF4974 domain-containing protein [Mucilaginibacter gynuensis]|uniref:DUF4974 domain-containing protein n=1 Tax=Mucilaginibacter gynuensis TaxID=1302236 RepID=A0ABP8GFP7_9SPHI